VDEDLPRSLARRLRGAGLDAVDVRDVGLRGCTDEEVLEFAVRESRVVVTADIGFGNILRFPLGEHAGILPVVERGDVALIGGEAFPRADAAKRIALDLDDGVKVNYGKFGDLLAEVKAVTGGK